MPPIKKNNLSSELTNNYDVLNNTFVSKTKKFETEIGDLKQSDFFPQIKIKRWSNESNFSLRLIDSELDEPVLETSLNKILWKKQNIEAHFYSLPKSNNLFEEGGFEFEVKLNSKPKSNVINFSIQSKNLNFLFQGEISDEEAQKELNQFNKLKLDSTIPQSVKDLFPTTIKETKLSMRPEKVINSYAVYGLKRDNEYQTGKAFHIFRPKIVDSNGVSVWCNLNINVKTGILSVIIPQKFLDLAVYPILLDPDFGYTTVGASNLTLGNNEAHRLSGNHYTASTGDTITSYSLHVYSYGGDASFEISVYETTSNIPDTRAFTPTNVAFNESAGVWITSATVSQALTAGVNYAVAYAPLSGTVRIQADSLALAESYDSTAGGLPATWTEAGAGNTVVSMYATYTAGSASYTKTFTTNALLKATLTKTFSVDVLLKVSGLTKVFTVDAFLQQTISKTFSVDSILKATFQKTISVDAFLKATTSKTFSADTLIQQQNLTKTFTLDSILKATFQKQFSGDGILKGIFSKSLSVDAILGGSTLKLFTVDAILNLVGTKTFTADAYLSSQGITKAFAVDSILVAFDNGPWSTTETFSIGVNTFTKTFTVDAFLQTTITKTFSGDSVLKSTNTKTFSSDAVLININIKAFTVDSILNATFSKSLTVDSILKASLTKSFSVDAIITTGSAKYFTVDAFLQATLTKSFTVNALIQLTSTKTFTFDAIIQKTQEKTLSVDAFLQQTLSKTFSVDSILTQTLQKTFSTDSILVNTNSKTLTVDSIITNIPSKQFTTDAIITSNLTKTFSGDSFLINTLIKTFTVDATISAKTEVINVLTSKNIKSNSTTKKIIPKTTIKSIKPTLYSIKDAYTG